MGGPNNIYGYQPSTTFKNPVVQTPNFNPAIQNTIQNNPLSNMSAGQAMNLIGLGKSFFSNPFGTLTSLGTTIGTTALFGGLTAGAGVGFTAGATTALTSLASTFGLGGLFGGGAAAAGAGAAAATTTAATVGTTTAASGGIMGSLAPVASFLATNPVGWAILGGIGVGIALFAIFGSPKRKAKKKAKKFNNEVAAMKTQASNKISGIEAQVTAGTLTRAEADTQIAGIKKELNTAILQKWEALPQKDKERIQKYASSVPACAEMLQTLNTAATELQQSDLAAKYPTIDFSASFNSQNKYQDGQFLINMMIRDENGNTLPGKDPKNPQLTAENVKRWLHVAHQNAAQPLTAEKYDHTLENGKLVKLADALKANTNYANFPADIKAALSADLTVEANAKTLLSKLDAIDDKSTAYEEDATKPVLTAEEKSLQLAYVEAEKVIQPTPEEALKTVIDAYKLPIKITVGADGKMTGDELALYNRAEGSTPAEKLANALFTKLNANNDNVLSRDEILSNGFGIDATTASLYDLTADSKASYEQTMLQIQQMLAKK